MARVESVGPSVWSGTTYRHTAPRRDPLSGEGARLLGGRWNAPDGTATIYLASPEATCRAEAQRLIDSQGVTGVRFPRTIHTISVAELRVVDLSDPDRLASVGLSIDDIEAADWSPCQRVGEAAAFLGHQGLVVLSATGSGIVIAAFEPRLNPSQLIVLDASDVPTPDDV